MSDIPLNNAGTWREQLRELLHEQRSVVTRLNELAQQQGDHIREARSEALLTVLARRQELIDGFLAAHTRMQSLLEGVGSEIDRLSESDRASIRTMIDEINTLLGEVLKRDESDRELLEESRQSVRDEMRSMSSGRQARNAYLGGNAGAGQNRFADRQG